MRRGRYSKKDSENRANPIGKVNLDDVEWAYGRAFFAISKEALHFTREIRCL